MAQVTFCYAESTDGKTIMIKRSEPGYFVCDKGYENIPAQTLNNQIGVTPEQAQKMYIGSLFGWDAPGAQKIDSE